MTTPISFDVENFLVQLDECDIDIADNYNIYLCTSASGLKYPTIWQDGKDVKVHRIVLSRVLGRPLLTSERTDHIDLDTCNDRRDNLRLATAQQNGQNRGKTRANTSGYKGVIWNPRNNKWEAYIKANGKRKYLGLHKDVIDAAIAYNQAASFYHGEFARLNVIP